MVEMAEAISVESGEGGVASWRKNKKHGLPV